MVHALHAAWRVLRAGGLLVDIQPDIADQPRVTVRSGARRIPVGAVRRLPDEDVLAANRAREYVLAEGWFDEVARRRPAFRSRSATLTQFYRSVRENSNWVVPAATRHRLSAAWRGHGHDAQIELGRVFSFVVMRKRPRPRGPTSADYA
jgi:hypothetical protein